MFSLNWVWINGWVNDREAGDLGRFRAHYDIIVMNSQEINDWCLKYLWNGSQILFYQQNESF